MSDNISQRYGRSRNGRHCGFGTVFNTLLFVFVFQNTRYLIFSASATVTLQRVAIENNYVNGLLTKQHLAYCSAKRVYHPSLVYDFEAMGWDPFDPAPTSNLEICLKSRITTQELASKASQARDHVCPATPRHLGLELVFQNIIHNRKATMTLTLQFYVPRKKLTDGSVRPPAVFSMLLAPSFATNTPLICAVVTPCDMWKRMEQSLKFQDVQEFVGSETEPTADDHPTILHPKGAITILFAATLPHHGQLTIMIESAQIVTFKLAVTQFPKTDTPSGSTTSTSPIPLTPTNLSSRSTPARPRTSRTPSKPTTSPTPSKPTTSPAPSKPTTAPTPSKSTISPTLAGPSSSTTTATTSTSSTHGSASMSATKRVSVLSPQNRLSPFIARTPNRFTKDESYNAIRKERTKVHKDESFNAIRKERKIHRDKNFNAIQKSGIYKDDSLNAIQKDSNRRQLLASQIFTEMPQYMPSSTTEMHPGSHPTSKKNIFFIPSVGQSILLPKAVCPFDYTCPVDRVSLVIATRQETKGQRRRRLQEVSVPKLSGSRIVVRNSTRRITARRTVIQSTRVRSTSKTVTSSSEDETTTRAVLNRKVDYIIGVKRHVYQQDKTKPPIAYDLATCIPWPLPQHLEANVQLTEYRLVEFLVPPTLLERQALLSLHALTEAHKHVVITTKSGLSLRPQTNGTQTGVQTTESVDKPQGTASALLRTSTSTTDPTIRSSLSVRLQDLHPDVEKNKHLLIGMGCAGGALIGLLVFASLRYRRWAAASAKQHSRAPPTTGVSGNRPSALQSDYTLSPQDDDYNSELTMGSHRFTRWHDSVPSFGYSMYGTTDEVASTVDAGASIPATTAVAVAATGAPHRAKITKPKGNQELFGKA